MSKWDQRFLELAQVVATWSKDPSTKVGAVIADSNNRVISLGFNGSPQGVDDTYLEREVKLLRTIHAEANALHFAHRDVTGCHLFVTHPPCCHCAGHLIQRGIASVTFPAPTRDFLDRWLTSYDAAMTMFSEAGVLVREVS
ncbi:deoxycytidylate deaminase [Ferribacterium limneticum]|uniref:deoxycytidylate deaminase n=1 Tax=Ferribacterium limneticum TaxID=76259 RepID=UPI001CF914A4|nr:dCMP deaminase family protein [Ferribacterium limneticum]UCV26697.1 dCMP deaminase family protein [Ferribacterium limneticum]UCV30614.1 dCMP deaminase family protein [Ferribacterium limneticum]